MYPIMKKDRYHHNTFAFHKRVQALKHHNILDPVYTRMSKVYPADVLISCINQQLVKFAAEKAFDPEKSMVYLKIDLDWYCFIKV